MKKLLLFMACLAFGFAKAGNIITSVTATNVDDCETAATIVINGFLPSSDAQIDSIVLTNELEVPGGITSFGITYKVYMSYAPGGIGLPVLVPFTETIELSRKEIRNGSFFGFGVTVAAYANMNYLEHVTGEYYYQQKNGCQYHEPEPLTHCDVATLSIDHNYDFCAGFGYEGGAYEIVGNTIYIDHNYRNSPFGPVCLTIAGPRVISSSIDVEGLNPGDYELITTLNVIYEDLSGGETSEIERHVSSLKVLQGNCPVTSIGDKANKPSLFYPSPVQTQITVSKEVVSSNIYSVSGQFIQSSTANQIDVSNLENGTYIIEMATAHDVIREKFLKQ